MTINYDRTVRQPDPTEQPADPVRDRLPEYATASALGSTPEQIYPDVAAHLAGCAACREELTELIELTVSAFEGHLDPAPNYPKPNLAFLDRPAPKTKQETCWFDELGRLVIEFSQTLFDTLRKPALAGASRGQFLFRYVQEPGPLRVTIEAYAEDTIRQEGRVQVNVDVHSRDALEQQGSHVTLRMDTSTWEGETDEMGSVDFAPIPLAMLPRMRVEIAPAGIARRER